MSVKFETPRTRKRRRVIVDAIVRTRRSITYTEIVHLMRSMGFAPTEGAVFSVSEMLRTAHGWVSWLPCVGVTAYHVADMTAEEERALRLQMGYPTPSSCHKIEVCTGWADLSDYVHRAAKKCGVVTGFDWHYFNYPSLRRFM